MTMDTFTLDSLRLKACFSLLRYYVLPKIKLQSYIGKILGHDMPQLRHMLDNASINWMMSCLTTHQFRAITSPTVDLDALLSNHPKLLKENAQCKSIQSADYRGRYVPKYPKSTHIIMYIHGGGFTSGSPDGVSAYLLQLSDELLARGSMVDIFAVGYDLAPEHPYPHALNQVISAYETLRSQNKPIILAGDSAGGNLCFALLRHLSKADAKPNLQSVGEKDPRSTGIAAACLASPWVNLRNESESFKRNAGKDCLDKSALDRWRNAYLAGQQDDEYTSPAKGIKGWKEILPSKVMLMTGELDLFVADILVLAQNIEQDGYEGLEVHIAPRKGHVWNLIDFGAAEPGAGLGLEGTEVSDAYEGVKLQADWIKRHCV